DQQLLGSVWHFPSQLPGTGDWREHDPDLIDSELPSKITYFCFPGDDHSELPLEPEVLGLEILERGDIVVKGTHLNQIRYPAEITGVPWIGEGHTASSRLQDVNRRIEVLGDEQTVEIPDARQSFDPVPPRCNPGAPQSIHRLEKIVPTARRIFGIEPGLLESR